MKALRSLRRAPAPLLTLLLAASVVLAQQPRVAPPQPKAAARESAEPASVTLDAMFGADSYAVYGEMRSVGQYVSSEDFKQMLEPLRLPGSMPAEMSDLIDFLSAHAEALGSARAAFAAMPVADGLPNVVAAVELPSAEDAQKLEPQLRQFLAAYHAAHPEAFGEGDAATRAAAQRPNAPTRPTPSNTVTPGAATPARAGDGAGQRGAGARRAQSSPQQSQRQSPPSQPQQSQQPVQTIRAGERATAEPALPYVIKRAGPVVAMADRQFTFRRLRGAAGSAALSNEAGFAAARARLATDTLFLYFNTTRMGRYTKRQVQEYERQMRQMEAQAEAARRSGANYNGRVAVPGAGSTGISVTTGGALSGNAADPVLFPPDPRPLPYGDPNASQNTGATLQGIGTGSGPGRGGASQPLTPEQQAMREEMLARIRESEASMEEMRRKADEIEQYRKSQPGYEEERRRREFENELGRAIFSGDVAQGAWSESIGVGASLEGDQIVVRALFYSDADTSVARPIPFVPVLISGPQVAPEAASVVPADSDIFISASLDVPQMYDYVASVFKLLDAASGASGNTDKLGLFDSQISSFEQQGKFRIREDLLNSLGNEIAVVLPGDYFGLRRPRRPVTPKSSNSAADAQQQPAVRGGMSAPIVVVSLKDKKTLQGILPRALEAVGMRGVSESQLFVKRGDAEVLAFGGGSAAFIGNFLVVCTDAGSMDWIIDSYNRGETLANSEEFRRASGWQERQSLGQAFVSNELLAASYSDVHGSIDDLDDPALRNYVARLDPNPGPVTYSLTKDGANLFHELHVPKNLLGLMSANTLVEQQTLVKRRNESRAMAVAQSLAAREREYKEANGRYATLDELKAKPSPMILGRRGQSFSSFRADGYDISISASGDKFEVMLTPNGYPKQGRRSFYVDQTGVLRAGDTGGRPANSDAEPVNNE